MAKKTLSKTVKLNKTAICKSRGETLNAKGYYLHLYSLALRSHLAFYPHRIEK